MTPEEIAERLVLQIPTEFADALASGALRAHMMGQILGQAQIEEELAKSVETRGKAGLITLDFNRVKEEAAAYAKEYRRMLAEHGGVVIQGKMVPWLAKRTGPEGLVKVAALIEQGVLEGWSRQKLAKNLGDVLDLSKENLLAIARTEMNRVQFHGSMNRYYAAGVRRVRWLLGSNPCPKCQARGNKTYDIDKVPEQPVHPKCCCGIAPDADSIDLESRIPVLPPDDLPRGPGSGAPAFIPSASVDEAASRIKERFGLQFCNPNGLCLDALNMFERRMGEICDRFPLVATRMQAFGSCQTHELERAARVAGYVPEEIGEEFCFSIPSSRYGLRGIYMNEAAFGSPEAMERTAERVVAANARGFFVAQDTEQLITHEAAHQFMNTLEDQHVCRWYYDRYYELKDTGFFDDEGGAVAEAVSEYAGYSAPEFFAECLTEFLHSPNPRPMAKEIGGRAVQEMEKIS